MPTTYPLDLISVLFSTVLVLGGLVWRGLLVRIRNIEAKQNAMPFHVLEEDISVIKRDIEWIKNLFTSKHHAHD